MKTYNRLIIDINKDITDIVTAKQNDTLSRYLDITLVDGGVPVSLTGHEVRFYARKADGNVIYNTAQLTDATKGRCQIELTSQALAVAQDLSCELTIYKDNREILSTKVFVIHVDKTLRNDEAVESSNEYGALVVLYQNLHESYLLMQDMIQKIGVPGSNAQTLQLDTMYKIWDYMIQYLKDNSSAGVVTGVNTINSKVGTTTDTGGTTTAGTVMGKLNSSKEILIKGSHKNENIKRVSKTSDIENQVVLEVAGSGWLHCIQIVNGTRDSQNATSVVADGQKVVSVSYTGGVSSGGSSKQNVGYYKYFSGIFPSTLPVNLLAAGDIGLVSPIYFDASLKVTTTLKKGSNEDSTPSNMVIVYELLD